VSKIECNSTRYDDDFYDCELTSIYADVEGINREKNERVGFVTEVHLAIPSFKETKNVIVGYSKLRAYPETSKDFIFRPNDEHKLKCKINFINQEESEADNIPEHYEIWCEEYK